jgi:ABC-type antimicrobial peptide transport system permease subunit
LVTGIIQNVPQNSTLQFDFLVPLLFIYDDLWGKGELNSWTNSAFITLVQLRENTSYKDVNKKIVGRIKKGSDKNNAEPFLTPFSDLYLHGLGPWSRHIDSVRMFSMIALFVLLIACINFMNLATARSGSRAREIGMRKVVGALKKDIINQFYGESILLSFISLFFALVLVSLLLPAFNLLSGKELALDFFGNQSLIFGLIGTALFTGIIAGSYPALFMSSFKPVKIFKGSSGSGSKGATFRKILVLLQYTISIILIIGTIVTYKQLNFMRSKDLGFDKKNLVYFPLNMEIWPISETVKKEISQHPAISHASLTSFTPTGFHSSDSGWNWEGKNPGTDPSIRRFCTDFNFLKTFKIQMAQGKFYSTENTNSTFSSPGKVVINETFASIIGKQNPVGVRLSMDSQNYICIGVVKDFNFFPLYSEIAPLAIFYKTENAQKSPRRYRYMFMKVQPGNIDKAVKHIERIYKKFSPGFPFSYGFLDETLGQLYNNEERLGSIMKYFAAIAIIISSLGLFGLASFMAEQRTREIGIRKVFGSSEGAIVFLLSKEFMKWVAAANVTAWPIAYFAMSKVLQSYAYRIDIGVGIFLFAGLTAVVIALLTVSYKSIKAAYANPVDALRYE